MASDNTIHVNPFDLSLNKLTPSHWILGFIDTPAGFSDPSDPILRTYLTVWVVVGVSNSFVFKYLDPFESLPQLSCLLYPPFYNLDNVLLTHQCKLEVRVRMEAHHSTETERVRILFTRNAKYRISYVPQITLRVVWGTSRFFLLNSLMTHSPCSLCLTRL